MTKAAKVHSMGWIETFSERNTTNPDGLDKVKAPGCAGLLMLIPGHLPASKIAGWAITKGLSTINSGYW